jgi:hypothetical protein
MLQEQKTHDISRIDKYVELLAEVRADRDAKTDRIAVLAARITELADWLTTQGD